MKKQISEWIHISDMGGDPWILPIWNAANQSTCDKLPKEIIELGISISLRLNMLPIVFSRINSGCSKLYEKLKSAGTEYLSTTYKEAYAYEIDDNLKYEILIDIDALLFELNSCCDLMCKLVHKLYNHVGKPIQEKAGLFVKKILEDANIQTDWFVDLDSHRNFFIHDGAPYIAIRTFNGARDDLIIMKENLKIFDNPDKFLLLSEVNNIVQGFIKAKPIIQRNLINLFKSYQSITKQAN